MTPTAELRFVEREVYDETTDFRGHTVRILQQKWKRVRYKGELDEFTDYEWRDVPLAKEEDR